VKPTTPIPPARRRSQGIALACITAVISGIAIFVNGYGVRAWREVADTATYTTLKNIVAALVLTGVAMLAVRRTGRDRQRAQLTRRQLGSLALIAVIGGSIPFLLFFEGFARASSGQAAFIHKTLVIWVTVMAIAFLKERIGLLHVAAVVLLVWGQAALLGGLADLTLGAGELMMLGATVLWSVEVVVAKRLLDDVPALTVGVARMAGGAALLLGYAIATGGLADIGALSASHIGWVLLTGLILSAYVGTWYSALARAQAADVTAVLVGGALITAVLNSGVRHLPVPSAAGLGLVGAGVVLVLVAMAYRSAMVR
jgi:drug/metabolite transporter (DMT)-like permease